MAIVKKKAEPAAEAVKAEKPSAKAKAGKAEKAAAPKAEKKAPVRRRAAAPAVKLFVEYGGKQVSQEEMTSAVLAGWTGEAVKTMELYVKPEDGAVYYVINGVHSGKAGF